ncbi:spartin [Strongylocentrotus purpuratus]|uniref:Spartin n=1 Tax=Strongylocentrotus purpuratus TaxID=7668 RepID=A0A7M7NGF5_STRPU|nr:spartin [Strongylocentrotus purpuratus]
MAEATRITYSSLHEPEIEHEDAKETLRTLKKCHDKAYADIQIALRQDEQSKREEAIRFYTMGLKSIAQAMKINCSGTYCVGSQWDHARNMQQKMKKTAVQMKTRLECLEQERSSDATGAACGTNQDEVDTDILSIYEENSSSLSLPLYAQSTTDAREVLHIKHGVQLFFINSSGHVSAPSTPGPLKMYKFPEDQALGQDQPPAFLQIGEWLYPLLPGQSPSLKAADGVYMFPDLSSLDKGDSVGVMFSAQVSKSEKLKFQQLIEQLTAMKEEEIPSVQEAAASQVPSVNHRVPSVDHRAPSERTDEREMNEEAMDTQEEGQKSRDVSQKIAKGLEVGAEWISWGVVKGAEIGSRLVGSGAKKLKEHIQPDDQPKEIDEKYQTGMVYAKKATGVAVKVSVVVLDSVCFLTKRVAEEVGPIISKQANKMLTNGEDETDGKTKAVIEGVMTVTASGLIGFGKVYRGLETAAIQLAKSVSQATVETVEHKYGVNAGRLTGTSLATVGNIGISAHNFNNIGVKAIAKRTAKDTGKVVVREMSESNDCNKKPKKT